VREVVDVYFDPVPPGTITWTNTAGDLSTNRGALTTLIAPDLANRQCTVTAETVGGTCNIDFDVLPPSGVQFTVLGVKHTHNACDAGFHAQALIVPTNVSFYNIEISELEANVSATGCYAYMNNTQHNRWTDQSTVGSWLTPSYDNYVNTLVDYVSLSPIYWPFSEGTFSVSIPWNYRKHGATNDGYLFTTLTQSTTATSAGRCTTSKNGVTRWFDYYAPTVNW
jgi:hypothetical protein